MLKPNQPTIILSILLLICFTQSLFAQPTRYLFDVPQYGLYDVTVLSNDNILYSGSSGLHLVDLNKNQVQVGSMPIPYGFDRYLTAGQDSSFYFATIDGTATYLTHYNHDFNGLWSKLIDSTRYYSVGIQKISPNRYLLTAGGNPIGSEIQGVGHNAFAVLDQNGNILMGKKWTSPMTRSAKTFATLGLHSDYFIAFSAYSGSFILHLDSTGTLDWQKKYSEGFNSCFGLERIDSSLYLLGGLENNSQLMQLDLNGGIIDRVYLQDGPHSLKTLENNRLRIAVSSNHQNLSAQVKAYIMNTWGDSLIEIKQNATYGADFVGPLVHPDGDWIYGISNGTTGFDTSYYDIPSTQLVKGPTEFAEACQIISQVAFPPSLPMNDSVSNYTLTDWLSLQNANSVDIPFTTEPITDLCNPTAATATVLKDVSCSIFPNPADNSVQIQLSESLQKQNYGVRIVDLSGKIRWQNRISGHAKLEIDISGLAPGLFILEMIGDKGLVLREKFIKQ